MQKAMRNGFSSLLDAALRDDQGFKKARVRKRTADFVFRKRSLCGAVTGTAGSSNNVAEKKAPRNYGILSHARIHYISLSERLRETRNRYILKLWMRPLTAKSRHDAVSFASINSPWINSYFFFLSIKEAERIRDYVKSMLLFATPRKCLFLDYSCRLAYSNTSAILGVN